MAEGTSFFSSNELADKGFRTLGRGVLVSRKASFYVPGTVSLGDNVRIDDFCILSGEIFIGSHVHVSAGCYFYGGKGIQIKDFVSISPRAMIFSAMDDFCGEYLVGPHIDAGFTHVTGGMVFIERFSAIGAGAMIFPALTIGEGVVVGAMSMVKKSVDPWTIVAGVPARYIKDRARKMKEIADEFIVRFSES